MENERTGYKKPPKHSRFVRGKSGNPSGRPIGSKNFNTEVEELLSKKIRVSEDGTERTISRRQALLLGLLNKALNGDVKAALSLIAIVQKLGATETSSTKSARSLKADDAAIIEEYIQERGAKRE